LLHGGKRWSVAAQNHVDANGNMIAPPGVVFTDDKGIATEYAVDWGAIDIYPTVNTDSYVGTMEWVPGDAKVSFVSRRVDSLRNVVDAGLYTLDVTYDSVTGAPVGAGNLQIRFSTATVNNALYGLVCPAQVYGHHWKPDGTAIAFQWHDPWASSDASRVCTVDSTVGSNGLNVIKIIYNAFGASIAWGSTGKIAFDAFTSNGVALYSIPENGGAVTSLDSARGSSSFFRNTRWSPDGAYVIYNFWTLYGSTSNKPDTSTVRRVNAGGGSVVTLVNSPGWTEISDWR
jgi:hypothetical protein